jgi:hypothetical protein
MDTAELHLGLLDRLGGSSRLGRLRTDVFAILQPFGC